MRVPAISHRAVVAATTLAAMVAGGACGLAQNGLSSAPGDDGGADAEPDAGTTDGTTAQSSDTGTGSGADSGAAGCSTLDASWCLGTVPPGWQPVGVADGGCGAGATPVSLVRNPRLPEGGCACGACQVVGSFQCTGASGISGGDGCGDPPIASASPGACTPAVAQHLQATAPMATGTIGCAAANDAGSGAVGDPLTLCVPGCTADFCAWGSRCIVTEGDLACPAGFTPFAKAGAAVDPGCAPCGCEAGPPSACQGTVTAFDNTTCNDSGTATYAVGTCNQYSTSTNYEAVVVTLVPPPGTCTSAATDEGDASLIDLKTICCK
jgi:hypothetical protein